MGKNKKNCNLWSWHTTLKQGQGHQTWYELVDPKQGKKNAKLEKPRLNYVPERANNKVLVK